MKIRIIVADDHKIVRDGLRTLLENQPDMEVIAEAEDGQTAVQLVREMDPDVVIMDVAMPVMNGIEATRQIAARHLRAKIIALSMYADRRFKQEMIRAGASDYLEKDCAFDELAQVIRNAMGSKSPYNLLA